MRQVKVACAQSDKTLRQFTCEALEDKLRQPIVKPRTADR